MDSRQPINNQNINTNDKFCTSIDDTYLIPKIFDCKNQANFKSTKKYSIFLLEIHCLLIKKKD